MLLNSFSPFAIDPSSPVVFVESVGGARNRMKNANFSMRA